MKKIAFASVLALSVASGAFAMDAHDTKKEAAPSAAKAAAAAPAAGEAIKNAELKDGTKISIKGEEVYVVGKDGKQTPAPDGVHELKDGSKLETKGGKIEE